MVCTAALGDVLPATDDAAANTTRTARCDGTTRAARIYGGDTGRPSKCWSEFSASKTVAARFVANSGSAASLQSELLTKACSSIIFASIMTTNAKRYAACCATRAILPSGYSKKTSTGSNPRSHICSGPRPVPPLRRLLPRDASSVLGNAPSVRSPRSPALLGCPNPPEARAKRPGREC